MAMLNSKLLVNTQRVEGVDLLDRASTDQCLSNHRHLGSPTEKTSAVASPAYSGQFFSRLTPLVTTEHEETLEIMG